MTATAKKPAKHLTPEEQKRESARATRETVESIVVAVILAFLFRTFVAEAFVIPTGSMAPTLKGRHMDVTCRKCGYGYQTGASCENEGRSQVLQTTCPICRYTMMLEKATQPNQRSFNGDRILVSKFSYALNEPQRWDVIVFKYPGNAKQNYIKRLVGMPNELLWVRHGNVYVAPIVLWASRDHIPELDRGRFPNDLREDCRRAGLELPERVSVVRDRDSRDRDVQEWQVSEGTRDGRTLIVHEHEGRLAVCRNDFRILRKPPYKVKAMLQLVDSTEHIPPELIRVGWPSRWQEWSAAAARWKVEENGRKFHVDGSATGSPTEVAWLRYRHAVPHYNDWDNDLRFERRPTRLADFRGELISDYYGYNDGHEMPPKMFSHEHWQGLHWVGDLAMECEAEVEGKAGQLWLDLVEGIIHYRCAIDVATGQATLSIDGGRELFTGLDGKSASQAVGETPIRGPGRYRLRFSNVDDELLLWVNDRLVSFTGPTTYVPRTPAVPTWSVTDAGDAEPCGVGSQQLAVSVRKLRVLRDVYYVANTPGTGSDSDYTDRFSDDSIRQILENPRSWDSVSLFAGRRNDVRFVLGPDQYFPMGDNSPQSKDARLWATRDSSLYDPPGAYVGRELLTGKALMIYWPHAWRKPIPFLPNVARMGLIR